jgi:CMP-N-acetylneuraminic acid synthetase
LTQNQEKILDTRRKIKQRFVAEQYNGSVPKVLGIVPVIRRSVYPKNDPFIRLAGKPLIWYTLSQVEDAKSLDKVVISSEDEDVLTYAKKFPSVIPMKRDPDLAKPGTKMEEVANNVLDNLKTHWGYEPDAVCTLYINTPFRKAHHIDKAVDTMKIFDVNSIISVQEELSHCYHHRRFGLEPIKNSASNLRIEREGIYKENGAIYLSTLSVLKENRLIGETVGHITMLPEESIKINSDYEFWMAEKIINEWN